MEPASTLRPAEVAITMVEMGVVKHRTRPEKIFFKAVSISYLLRSRMLLNASATEFAVPRRCNAVIWWSAVGGHPGGLRRHQWLESRAGESDGGIRVPCRFGDVSFHMSPPNGTLPARRRTI